jgi:hypothetical protein
MLDFSSSWNLIRSLVLKALGNPEFKFIEFGDLETLRADGFEFITNNYKFTIMYDKDKIRVYDNGNVFFLPSDALEDLFIWLAFHEDYMKELRDKLQDFYKFEVLDIHSKTQNTYKFTKLDKI